MRRVIIRRGTLELASAGLTRPVVTIGRSPACDVVLRASGVKPVHFMLEWVGGGDFNPDSGYWSIFDISESAEAIGEGVIVGDEPVQFRGFQIQCREDNLTTEWDGGGISETLAPSTIPAALKPTSRSGYVLEVVQGRADSGAIEEVLHVRPRRFIKKQKPFEKVPEFKILWNPEEKSSDTIRVLLSEMPGASVYQKGVPLGEGKTPDLWPNDLLEVRWKGLRFFLRLVPWTNPPKIRSDFFQDKLLVGLFTAALLIGASITVLSNLHPVNDRIINEAPPRVAKVEIQNLEDAPPPPPPKQFVPPPPVEEKKMAVPAEKTVVQGGAPREISTPVIQKNTQANLAAPKTKPNPGPRKSGLNVAAAPKDVNTMGLLGALKKTTGGPKGSGIRADQIVDQGLIASAASGDHGKVVLKSGAIGDLGEGTRGSPKGDGSSLAAASTTLSGNHEFNPKSTGPIAGPGGTSAKDFAAGAVLGTGAGNADGNGMGGLDGAGSSGLQTSGGLTRDIVRAVIAKYRSQIRNCYERALLVNSDVAGRIVYQWKITPTGPVVTVQLLKSDVHFDKLEGCVRDVIRSMQFPAAENKQPTTVIYPFAFQSHKKN